MFCVVVFEVFRAGSPADEELFLSDAILDPIKTHVHGFGAFLFDRVVGEAGGG